MVVKVYLNSNEQYKQPGIIIIILIIILSLLLLILCLSNLRRKSIAQTLKKTAYELALLQEKYDLTVKNSNCAIWEIDLKTGNISFSDNIHNILDSNIVKQETIYSFPHKYLADPARIQLEDEFRKYIRDQKPEINIQIPIMTASNNKKWLLLRGQGIKTFQGIKTVQGIKTFQGIDTFQGINTFQGTDISPGINISQRTDIFSGINTSQGIDMEGKQLLHGTVLDITKIKEQEVFIEHLAHHDYLTDLPNRIYFMDRLKDELEIGKPLSIIMLDIDNFKAINDTLGHIYGDLLLKEIANRLITLQTKRTFFSRFGGDEFLILITDEADNTQTKCFIQSIITEFKKPFFIGEQEHFVELSMGITRYPEDSVNLHQLIMNADTAMYKVKHSGKNSYQFYNEGMQESVRKKAGIEALLRKALKNDGFYLLYQPRVNVRSGEIEGFEALLRLKHHKIPPDVFIKVAEESDIILDIGRKVTQKAIAQINHWKRKGYPPKVVSINFSSKQLRDSGYIKFLHNTLIQYEVDPSLLEIEITESILLAESNKTIEFLYQLRELGLNIALDDFGTGYSSINYLTYIPVSHVKLDKSLSDKFLLLNDIRVMNSIISLAHSLNLKITAEGIEKREQYELLRESDCDYIQGYYFSKPLEVDQASEIYNNNLLV